MRALLLAAVLAVPAAPSPASRPWGPEQATGAPDTPDDADRPTSWASLAPDGGPEWLELRYDRAVPIAEVRVRETHGPGAVVRITAAAEGGEVIALWEGKDPTREAPADLVARPQRRVVSRTVRVWLDTRLVPSWNEIDAVELVGTDGSRQWATSATASSTYAVQTGFRADPWARAQGKAVRLRLADGSAVAGQVQELDGDLLVLRSDAGKTLLVRKDAILLLELP